MRSQKKPAPEAMTEVVTAIQLGPEQYEYLFALGRGDAIEGISILISEREKVANFIESLNLGNFSRLAKIALNLKKFLK